MALLIMVDAATAIQEQTNRHPFPLRISERERERERERRIHGLSSSKYGSGWIGQVILIGWKCSASLTVKLNYAPNKKYKFLSATNPIAKWFHNCSKGIALNGNEWWLNSHTTNSQSNVLATAPTVTSVVVKGFFKDQIVIHFINNKFQSF